MGRAPVWTVAGAAFGVAVVLTALGVGDRADALPNWQALVLGLVQGATELLPISSSGHLILVPWLADWEYLKEHDAFNQTFDVSLHLGTLVAVVLYFREDIVRLAAAWVRNDPAPPDRDRGRTHRLVRGGGDRACCAHRRGRRERDRGEARRALADRDPAGVLRRRCSTSPTGAPRRRTWADLGLKAALGVGLAQTLSLMPGVSRVGDHDHGGTVPPARSRLGGAVLVPAARPDHLRRGRSSRVSATSSSRTCRRGRRGPFVVGSLASLASGLIAISALLGYVRRHDYSVFVVYRLLVAAIVLLLIATGVRTAGF